MSFFEVAPCLLAILLVLAGTGPADLSQGPVSKMASNCLLSLPPWNHFNEILSFMKKEKN
jgi:hypothetical protein